MSFPPKGHTVPAFGAGEYLGLQSNFSYKTEILRSSQSESLTPSDVLQEKDMTLTYIQTLVTKHGVEIMITKTSNGKIKKNIQGDAQACEVNETRVS